MAKNCEFGMSLTSDENFCNQPGTMMLKGSKGEIVLYCEQHYDFMLHVGLTFFAGDRRLPHFLKINGIKT